MASTVANAHRDPKKHRAFKPQDFMPRFEESEKAQTWQDQLAMVEMMNAALRGDDLREEH